MDTDAEIRVSHPRKLVELMPFNASFSRSWVLESAIR
jgi:hypothetical protein